MDDVFSRLANLLTVKSLVTLILTVVFAILAATHQIAQDFMTIYAVIIAFYFGTQSQRSAGSETPESPSADEIAEAIATRYQIEVKTDGKEGVLDQATPED